MLDAAVSKGMQEGAAEDDEGLGLLREMSAAMDVSEQELMEADEEVAGMEEPVQGELPLEEPTQEQQQLHPNCTFVCITEDINGGSVEVTSFNSDTTTLDEAKEWIDENQSSGHYSCHNFNKIIVIDSNGEVEQIYTKKPEDYGSWCFWY